MAAFHATLCQIRMTNVQIAHLVNQGIAVVEELLLINDMMLNEVFTCPGLTIINMMMKM